MITMVNLVINKVDPSAIFNALKDTWFDPPDLNKRHVQTVFMKWELMEDLEK